MSLYCYWWRVPTGLWFWISLNPINICGDILVFSECSLILFIPLEFKYSSFGYCSPACASCYGMIDIWKWWTIILTSFPPANTASCVFLIVPPTGKSNPGIFDGGVELESIQTIYRMLPIHCQMSMVDEQKSHVFVYLWCLTVPSWSCWQRILCVCVRIHIHTEYILPLLQVSHLLGRQDIGLQVYWPMDISWIVTL